MPKKINNRIKLLPCNCFFCRLIKLYSSYNHKKLYEKKFKSTNERYKLCKNKHLWKIYFTQTNACCCLKNFHACQSGLQNLSIKCNCFNCCILLKCNCNFCINYRKTKIPSYLCQHKSCTLTDDSE